MQKIHTKLAALCGGMLLIGLASCSQEELSINNDGTVTFSVSTPVVGTRAAGDGNTASTLTCYAYDANGKYVDTFSGSMSGGKGSVTARLASGVSYKLVFWSDAAGSPYAIDAEKGTMTVNYSGMTANSDVNDAFYTTLAFKGGDAKEQKLTLTRPLAQINFGSDDTTLPAVGKAYSAGIYTTVTTDIYTKLNLVTGEVSPEPSDRVTYTTTIAPISGLKDETFPVTHPESTTDAPRSYAYTNMLYALVPPSGTASDLTFKSYNAANASTPIWTVKVPAAPLKQNFRTNVFGSLLTSATDFQVTIDPNISTLKDIDADKLLVVNASTPEDLSKAWESKATEITVTLLNPIEGGITIPASTEPKTVKINLNGNPTKVEAGNNITVDLYDDAPATRAREDGRAENPLIVANAGGTVNVHSGRYYTYGVEAVQLLGGTVNIYGGEFSSFYPTSVAANTTKVIGNTGGTLYIEAGRFQAKSSTYPNTDYDRNSELTQIGVTGIKAEAKISKAYESSATKWVVVENAWHKGVTKTLTWTSLGFGKLRDAWLGSWYSWDLPVLTVEVQRCNEYPTLYRIHNPYKTVKSTWDCNLAKLTILDEGEIRFDMRKPDFIAVGGDLDSGGMYYHSGYKETFKCYAANYEGAAYYGSMSNDLDDYKEILAKEFGVVTNSAYDAATNKITFRNIIYGTDSNGTPLGTSYRSKECSLVMPDGFILLDINGKPVK